MYEHISLFDIILQDIEEVDWIILTDHDWQKQYTIRNDFTYYEKFPWKQALLEQQLEGSATYNGEGQTVCSNQVPKEPEHFKDEFCHPCYQFVLDIYYINEKKEQISKVWGKVEKLVKHMHFHH